MADPFELPEPWPLRSPYQEALAGPQVANWLANMHDRLQAIEARLGTTNVKLDTANARLDTLIANSEATLDVLRGIKSTLDNMDANIAALGKA